METTTALPAPPNDDEFGDLVLDGAEERLAEIEREHLARGERAAALRDRQTVRPNRGLVQGPPFAAAAGELALVRLPNSAESDEESCWRCGKSRKPAVRTDISGPWGASWVRTMRRS